MEREDETSYSLIPAPSIRGFVLCYRIGVYTLIISSDWLLSHFAAADGKHRVVPLSIKASRGSSLGGCRTGLCLSQGELGQVGVPWVPWHRWGKVALKERGKPGVRVPVG